MVKISKEEREWRAESDAHTLIEAEAINGDSARKKAAIAKAKSIAEDAKKKARAAEKVAKKVTKRKKK